MFMFTKFDTKLLLFFLSHKILCFFFHFDAIIPLKKPSFSEKIPKFALEIIDNDKQH